MLELEKFLEISRDLERHHSLFYTLWEMGKPHFTNTVSTAGVIFNKDGHQLSFLFNTDFWNSISDYERSFVISHECLHVILNHGIRTRSSKNNSASNIALDIVVNHLLINKFGFERPKLSSSLDKKLCWTDTVFKETIQTNMCFEYYYNLLKKDCPTKNRSIDDHKTLYGSEWSDAISDLSKKMSNEEKDGIKDIIKNNFQREAGRDAGCCWEFVDTKGCVPEKRKWETVIKNWSKKHLKEDFSYTEQWARLNRRMCTLSDNLFLPSEMELEHTDNKDRITVFFYQDTSGSCYNLKDRFFKAAKTLPEDRFDIKMFCFDTKVYETSLKSGRLYGFGGTSFMAIEDHIQKYIKKETKYPEAVFVISDGYSNSFLVPQCPKNWYVFLSTSHTACIHKDCNVFKLSDFE